MKKLFQSLKANIWFRFFLLILSAAAGIVLLVVLTDCCKGWLVECLNLGQDSRFIGSLSIIILGLFVFISLWCFRTWDTKEKLAKSEEQINQNNYFQGLDNLVSNESLKVEIGVQQLLELSKVTEKYKDGIKFAFIERLKSPLKKKEGKVIYFFYAQYIVNWLSKNYPSTKLDLIGCNFDYQKFAIGTNFDILKKRESSLEKLSFVGAHLVEANLNNAYLIGTDLSNANLSNADLNKAILYKAILYKAILSEANLNEVDLAQANLSEANLFGVNLNDAMLNEAILNEAILSEARLHRTNLSNAFFNKNQHPTGIYFEEWGYKLEDFEIDSVHYCKLVSKDNYV